MSRSGHHTRPGCSAPWWRLCALVAAARSESERDALAWLESRTPPLILAAAEVNPSRSASYVVTNQIEARGGSQTHPGRSNKLRMRARSYPASPVVQFVWDDADAAEGFVACLDELCRRVPYMGRSSGVAVLAASASVTPGVAAAAGGVAVPVAAEGRGSDGGPQPCAEGPWQVFEPCDQPDGELTVRVPYAGCLSELDELYAADRPAWQASRYLT